MEIWYLYILLGIVAGIVSVSLGVGAGIVMVPLLVIAFHFPQKSAQGIALAVMVPMALVGGFRYWLHTEIELDLRIAGLVAAGGILGAFFGFYVPANLPADTLRKLFAIFMIIVAVRMLWPKSEPRNPSADIAAPASGAHSGQAPP